MTSSIAAAMHCVAYLLASLYSFIPKHSQRTTKTVCHSARSQPGPKSGGSLRCTSWLACLLAWTLLVRVTAAPGARVWGSALQHPPAVTTIEPRRDPRTTNPNGQSRRIADPFPSCTKRSYKRAIKRAAKHGFTHYKGALHNTQSLCGRYISNAQQQARTVSSRTSCYSHALECQWALHCQIRRTQALA